MDGLARSLLSPRRRTVTVTVVLTAVALGLRLVELARPGFLFGAFSYDDGVYFGTAVMLVHGHLPYRDFVLLHPPLLPILMTPLAALSSLIGTAKGLALARLATVIVSAGAVPLVARALWHRGVVAVVLGAAIVAGYEDSIRAGNFLELEPWLVLLCLAGTLVVFAGESIRTGRALVIGGALFGLAAAVKLWAVAPVLVIALLLGRRPRDLARFLAGCAGAWLVVVLPFALAAPSQFLREVFITQSDRPGPRVGVMVRLTQLAGVGVVGDSRAHRPGLLLALVAAVVAAALVGLCLRWRRTSASPLELYAVGMFTVVLAMFLASPQFYFHYGAFLAPWLALVVALAVAADSLAVPRARALQTVSAGGVLTLVAVGAVVVVVGILRVPAPEPSAAAIQRVVPSGACVLTNQPTALLLANRYPTGRYGCPVIVDPDGIALMLARGHDVPDYPSHTPVVRTYWREAVRHARFLVWTNFTASFVPRTDTTRFALATGFSDRVSRPDGLRILGRPHGRFSTKPG